MSKNQEEANSDDGLIPIQKSCGGKGNFLPWNELSRF